MKDPLENLFAGRFERRRRIDEPASATPQSSSVLEHTFHTEEVIYKFFAPELQLYFPTNANDQALFVRLLHAEGIDTGSLNFELIAFFNFEKY